MRRVLFGEHGYGLDSLGSEESVEKITVADLKLLHQQLTTPANCVLAVFGDVKTADVKAAVEKALGNWKPESQAARPSDHQESLVLNSIRRVEETRDKKQAVLVIGFPGTTMADEDKYSLDLLQECCSDLGSRLFLRIREQLGLAYYVGAQNFAGLAPGYFAFYTGTEPAKAAQVEKELLAEAALLRTEGLTAEELKRAKAKIIGQKKIARADLGNLATTAALDELYGLGWQRADLDDIKYAAVTLEQVQAAARKYLREDAYVVSIVKPDTKSAPEK
jgi:zinc protease